ncbi:MAG: crossover junction endodeoxyribonuclease RuvC [Proteobacteria bacterium]|nr:crossover junction endodeoxyribonuclease RuvC [Pseudomonadota bacterium]
MRIIGLDPGLRNTGWGVIEVEDNRFRYVADGTVRPKTDQLLSWRLRDLHDGLAEAITEYAPDEAAVEETFVNKNPKSTLKLGEARGVVVLVPALAGLPVAEYSANRIKKAVVGAGHAGKEQVQMMVRRILPGCNFSSPDAADALAVAICHANFRETEIRWQAGEIAARITP